MRRYEDKLEWQKQYYKEHKEERITYAQEYRKKNAEKVRSERRADYRNKPELFMLHRVRARAKKEGLECDITVEDIHIPKFCPLLGVPLVIGAGRERTGPNSPSLDKIDPLKGYVKGNVWVISKRANAIKQDCTFEEFEVMYHRWNKMKELNYPHLGKECTLDMPEEAL